MGLEVDRIDFDEEDRRRFSERLESSLDVLAEVLARPGFGEGEASLGAELEVSLIDANARPAMCNEEVIAKSGDPRLTVELDRFNIEANLNYGPLSGNSLSRLARECDDCLAEIGNAAALYDARTAMIGILPTITRAQLEHDAMTDALRYAALSRSLRALRDEPFLLDIHGDEHLHLRCEDVTYEGAATSFQLHLRVAPNEFARAYDAIQLATPIAIALSGNAPTFLGRRLWHETRIALFKQAVDHRVRARRGRSARTSLLRYELDAKPARPLCRAGTGAHATASDARHRGAARGSRRGPHSSLARTSLASRHRLALEPGDPMTPQQEATSASRCARCRPARRSPTWLPIRPF